MSTLDDLRWDSGHQQVTETDWNTLLTLLTTGGGRVKPASYVIWQDGATINATNGTTGVIDYSGTVASTVFQSVINALTSGGLIFVREGTYSFTAEVALASDIEIVGVYGATIIQGGAVVNGALFQANGNLTDITIRDLILDGNTNFYSCLNIENGTSHVLIDRCVIENGYDRCLWLWDGGTNPVVDVVVHNTYIGPRGIVAGRPAITAVDPSVDVSQAIDCVFDTCFFDGDPSILGGFGYPMILLWDSGEECYRNKVLNSTFYNHSYDFIRVCGTRGTKILGNNFFQNIGTQPAIVFQDYASYNAMIAHNFAWDVNNFIACQAADLNFEMVVDDNEVYQSRQSAIILRGKGDIRLSNNRCIDCNQDGKAWYDGGAIIAVTTQYNIRLQMLDNYVWEVNTNGRPFVLNASSAVPLATAIFEGNIFDRTENFYGGNHPTLPDINNAELYLIAERFLANYRMGRNYGFTTLAPERVLLQTGYETAGTATIVSGVTSIGVLHGAVFTPTLQEIVAIPTNNLGLSSKFWISNPTVSGFNINVDADPGVATATFIWEVTRIP